MRIGRAAAYALIAMLAIASQASNPAASMQTAQQIAHHTGVPVEYLRKILQRLSRARLVRSERGRAGGFRLGRSTRRISMLQVVEAIEGPVDDLAFLDDAALYASEPGLRNLRRWRHSAAGELRDLLKRTSLQDLLAENAAVS